MRLTHPFPARHVRIVVLMVISLAFSITSYDLQARRQKPQPSISIADLAQRIHAQINQERKKHHLGQLAWSDDLAHIAEKHSQDMEARNYLDHVSPEGKSFSDRYHQAGYRCEIREGNLIHLGAENIALSHLYNSMIKEAGATYYNWNSTAEIVKRTVTGWMNSPGHRKNILTPHWQHEGIGIQIEAPPGNKVYITENFC